MKIEKILTRIVLIFCLILLSKTFTFDLSQTDKQGQVLSQAMCNKDTVVDVKFSANTVLSNCSPTGCTLTNPQQSTMRFLNVKGQQLTYTLQNATIVQTPGGVSRPQEKGLFEFRFQNNGQWVMLGVPFSNDLAGNNQSYRYELDLTKDFDSALSFLQSMTNQANNSTGIPLSSFNYLNRLQYGMFYHVANSSTTTTYLLSYFILSNLKVPSISSFPPIATAFPQAGADYQGTGDFLCYGSPSQGIFQTHMRQSYPLWTAWIAIFIYWIYYLTTDLIVLECYDKRFQNNKWTCWSIYSLYYLGHEEYFTKLSRQTMMLITFCWQALVIGLLYSNINYGQPPIMILWAAAIAVVTALPFPYVLGYFFLRKIYEKSLQKFQVMKKMHGLFNKKDGVETYEKQLDDLAQDLYGLYYWFYVIAFVFFTAFWILTVHEMMVIPRQFYYLHRYWLASLAVAFGLEHLVIDPLMTLIFGNFTFYRIRGFYYDYRLGQNFKQLQE